MKPFDLEAALRGDPVVTRDGRPVTQVTEFEGLGEFCVAAVMNGSLAIFKRDGHYCFRGDSLYDLFMAPKKVTLWVNVYRDLHHLSDYSAASTLYKTKNAADDCAQSDRVACVPIEFEV